MATMFRTGPAHPVVLHCTHGSRGLHASARCSEAIRSQASRPRITDSESLVCADSGLVSGAADMPGTFFPALMLCYVMVWCPLV